MGKANPVVSGTRIETIDVLRGFALAGIFYAHMVFWYTGAALPTAQYFKYDSFVNTLAIAIFGAFVFGKFFSVFSFLFGLSFYFHFQKNERDTGYLKFYLWRLVLLLIIGIVHHLFWRGDILSIYAVLGVLLVVFSRLPSKLILGLSLVLILNIPTHVYDLFGTAVLTEEVEFPMAREARAYYKLIKEESLIHVLKANWDSWPAKIQYQLDSGRFLMTFGYFLLGFYAGRKKLFSAMDKNISKFKIWNKQSQRIVLILLAIGLLMYFLGYVTLPALRVAPQLQWISALLFSVYNAAITVLYLTGISLLFRHHKFYKVLKPLAAMGKMALTIYLLQSFFGLLIYYQFGFGLFDKTSPAFNVVLAVIVFYLQLRFSQLWLRRFKQGPLEWLWKGLSHFKFPSITRQKPGWKY